MPPIRPDFDFTNIIDISSSDTEVELLNPPQNRLTVADDFSINSDDIDSVEYSHSLIDLTSDIEVFDPIKQARDQCLSRCLDVFPDIDRDHVLTIFDEVSSDVDRVIEKILESPAYPKRQTTTSNDKREASVVSDDGRQYEQERQQTIARGRAGNAMLALLKSDFPEIPETHIKRVKDQKVYLFHIYLALDQARRTVPRPYRPRHPPRASQDLHDIERAGGQAVATILPEFLAARKRCQRMGIERINLMASRATNSMAEWFVSRYVPS